METNTMIYIAIGLIGLIAGAYYYYYSIDKKNQPADGKSQTSGDLDSTRQLKLQAYERLVILAERIALPNVVSRTNEPGLTKRDMQQLLVQSIRQEYEYNLSQQIYVTSESWEAIRTLKEQNIHLINQVAAILPPETSGAELNRKILEFLMSQPQGSMHSLVQEALSHEAKKLMA